jgi:hypothetical protein
MIQSLDPTQYGRRFETSKERVGKFLHKKMGTFYDNAQSNYRRIRPRSLESLRGKLLWMIQSISDVHGFLVVRDDYLHRNKYVG